MDINYSKERRKLLEKRLDPNNKNWQEKLLMQHSIVPIVTFAPREQTRQEQEDKVPKEYINTSFVGKGSYGEVFRAAYKGKEVAVKITDDDNEVYNWYEISHIVSGAPSDISKHFPKIYKIIESSESDGRHNIIVMELLTPLNAHVEEKLFERQYRSNPEVEKIRAHPFFKDEENLYAAYNFALERLDQSHGLELKDEYKQELFHLLLSFKPLSKSIDVHTDFPTYVTGQFVNVVNNMSIEDKQAIVALPGTPHILGHLLGDYIMSFIDEQARAGNFPWDASVGEADIAPYRNLPESSSFLKALEYLKERGIDWSDVHHKNIMIRPSTGDLVLIDVGLFGDI